MITYLDNSNAKQYHILFDKATKLLKEIKPSSIEDALQDRNPEVTSDELWNDFSISSLNEYFAYLQDILAAAKDDNNEDAERFYVRLPLDEDVFAINADTREIIIPNSFANAGVGVQGDELAEVVYFTIDRFFDSMDLASDNIHIAIQWELNRNGEQIKGFSRNFGKDIESLPGKIIFGWPISHELTETPGSIRFAVRFYGIDAASQTFNYSLTTLPATVKINSSIDHAIIEQSSQEINHGSIITERIQNAGIYDASMPTPSLPIITVPLFVKDPPTDAVIVDLPIDNGVTGSVILGVGAQPSDIGVVGYAWKQFTYGNGTYNDRADSLNNNVSIDYILTTEELNPNYQYFTKTGEGDNAIYSMLDIENTLEPYGANNTYPYLYEVTEMVDDTPVTSLVTEPVDGAIAKGYAKTDAAGGDFIAEVYKKLSTVEVNEPGIYTVDISARALVNTVTAKMKQENGIKIPGPLTPIINMPEAITTVDDTIATAHIIIGNETQTLIPNAIAGETGRPESEVGNPVIQIEYAWEKYDIETDSWIPVTDIENKVSILEDNLEISDIINSDSADGDKYHFIATSTRNGVSTNATSGVYRVTHAPTVPTVQVREYNSSTNSFGWVDRNYTSPMRTSSINNEINLGVKTGETAETRLMTDSISYVWVKANRSSLENDASIYQPDLPATDQNLSSILINKINEALHISDVLIADSNPDDDTDTSILRAKDDIIQALEKISDATMSEEDAQDGFHRYRSRFTPTETGIYYCVVINELNNNIAVQVSPFFSVS